LRLSILPPRPPAIEKSPVRRRSLTLPIQRLLSGEARAKQADAALRAGARALNAENLFFLYGQWNL
jgi:hypothetical protein